MTLPDWFFSWTHNIALIIACSKDLIPLIEKRSDVFRQTNFIVEYDREYDKQVKEWI